MTSTPPKTEPAKKEGGKKTGGKRGAAQREAERRWALKMEAAEREAVKRSTMKKKEEEKEAERLEAARRQEGKKASSHERQIEETKIVDRDAIEKKTEEWERAARRAAWEFDAARREEEAKKLGAAKGAVAETKMAASEREAEHWEQEKLVELCSIFPDFSPDWLQNILQGTVQKIRLSS